MNTDTYEIKQFTDEDINKLTEQEKEKWVSLNRQQHELLQGMNRKQRREYFKKHKNEFNGLSWKEVNGSGTEA